MSTPLFLRKLTSRVPRVTDYVWWAPKQLEGVVISVGTNGFRFHAGPLIERKEGKQVPEWTVTANFDAGTWDESLHCWIVGQGKHPEKMTGMVLKPDAVVISAEG